jgi:hypothetical protein
MFGIFARRSWHDAIIGAAFAISYSVESFMPLFEYLAYRCRMSPFVLWPILAIFVLFLSQAFHMPGRVYTAKLSNALLFLALMAILFYSIHAYAFWMTSLRQNAWIIAWLIVTGFLPLLLFIWSYYEIHVLLQRIKFLNVEEINSQIQLALQRVKAEQSKEQVEVLNGLIEVQSTVEKSQEWSISQAEVMTFLVALIIPLTQVITFIVGFGKP